MSKSKITSGSAVPVSYNLQLAVVTATLFAGIVELASFFNMTIKNQGPTNSSFLLFGLSMTLFPLVMLIVAYILSPGYKDVVSRTFIALVKTVLFMAIYGAITVIYRIIQTNYFVPSYGTEELSFWYSPNLEYVFMAAALISLVVTHYTKGTSKK